VTLPRALPGEGSVTGIDVHRWRCKVPDGMWPVGFAESGIVLRADVFDVAERWRSGEVPVTQFVVAAFVWGHGNRGYGPYRTRRVMDQDREGVGLDAVLAQLRTDVVPVEALTDAYERFRSTSKLGWLGPAFFTKLLYFAGYRRGRGGLQPLILDRIVASRLPPDAGPASRFTTGWTTATWARYLHWAADQARRSEYHDEAELVEIGLFANSWAPGRHHDAGEWSG
jgi:hypothetical protein